MFSKKPIFEVKQNHEWFRMGFGNVEFSFMYGLARQFALKAKAIKVNSVFKLIANQFKQHLQNPKDFLVSFGAFQKKLGLNKR